MGSMSYRPDLRMRVWMLSYTSRMNREKASPVRSRTWDTEFAIFTPDDAMATRELTECEVSSID